VLITIRIPGTIQTSFSSSRKADMENYRLISLLSDLYKMSKKIVANRVSQTFIFDQPIEQTRFRNGFNTIDHIQIYAR